MSRRGGSASPRTNAAGTIPQSMVQSENRRYLSDMLQAPASGGCQPIEDLRNMSVSNPEGTNIRDGHAAASRVLLFCGLVGIGFVNGISERAGTEIGRDGVALALFNTLGVSAVVWAAGIVGMALLWRTRSSRITAMDGAVSLFAAACFLVPAPFFSWFGIAAIGAALRLSPQSDSVARRAGTVFLALTIPVLWARIVFASASNTILGADAKLIGWLVGTQSRGNTIDLADGSGVIFLEPACSSLTNLSLVVLCGVLFVKAQDRPWSKRAVAALAAAGVVTVLINVLRISLIGVMPEHYDDIHGPLGATLAAWATIAAMLAIFSYGIGIGEQGRP
ncbi:archaeosortase/exosortase family protein [Mesorhizobium sp. SP-1A]|uniref:archaeosortase/exosortase family protein n=1 Tax=Mesorhizobium sp. SP-1A TaxID=3077840 RepID=UPI0028F7212F|nr:archaeosortase/exosortase family protein [Mesorhizobium sp. SP-1A]